MQQPRTNNALADVSALFIRATHTLHSHGMGKALALMNESGLTFPQLITLNVLRESGRHSLSEIAAHIKLSKAATSHLVDRLVRAGLVRREEHDLDRRKKRVALTSKGNALLDRINNARTSGLSSAFNELSAETRQMLATALVRVLAEFAATPKLSRKLEVAQ